MIAHFRIGCGVCFWTPVIVTDSGEVAPPLTGADEHPLCPCAYHKTDHSDLQCGRFSAIAQAISRSCSHLAVYQDNDPAEDMTYGDIVRAIANLDKPACALLGVSGHSMLTSGSQDRTPNSGRQACGPVPAHNDAHFGAGAVQPGVRSQQAG